MNVPRFLTAQTDDLEEGLREKVHALPTRTPAAPEPSLDNVSDLVAKGITALVDEHTSLLGRAKTCFEQVEACLKAATDARASMLAARKEALGEAPVANQ